MSSQSAPEPTAAKMIERTDLIRRSPQEDKGEGAAIPGNKAATPQHCRDCGRTPGRAAVHHAIEEVSIWSTACASHGVSARSGAPRRYRTERRASAIAERFWCAHKPSAPTGARSRRDVQRKALGSDASGSRGVRLPELHTAILDIELEAKESVWLPAQVE